MGSTDRATLDGGGGVGGGGRLSGEMHFDEEKE